MKQYQKFFELEDVELEFTDDALDAVADQALLRGTGARGLRAILEEVLLNVMYDLPSRTDVEQVRHRPRRSCSRRSTPRWCPATRPPRQQRPAPGRLLNLAPGPRGAGLARPAHQPRGARRRSPGGVEGLSLDRMRAARATCSATRSDAQPVDPHHRHQRQGLGRPHGHRAARRPRPHGRHLHQPAPRADQRAHRPQRRADLRRRSSPRCSPTSPRVEPLARRAGRRTSSCSPRPRSAGSPTRPSTWPWSRSACSGAGTPPTSSTARSRCVTNVGHDHTDGAGRLAPARRRGEGRHRQAGLARSCSARPIPTLRRRVRRRRRRRDAGARDARLRLRRRTGWPSAGACSTCARPAARYDEVFLPLHGATRATTPRSRWPPPRRSSTAPLDRRRRAPRRSPRCACPGASRSSAATRWSMLDGAHNPDGAEAAGRHPRRGLRGRRRARSSWSACSTAATRASCSSVLDAAGRGRGRVLHARLAAGAAAPTSSRRSCAALGGAAAGRARRRRGRRSRRSTAPSADDVVLVTGSLYTVGRRPQRRPPSRSAGPSTVTVASDADEPDLRDVQARRRRARPRRRDRRPASSARASRSSPPSCARSTRRWPRSTTPSTPSKPFFGELVDLPHPVARLRHGGRGAGREHVLARAAR